MSNSFEYIRDFVPSLLTLNERGYVKSRESTKLEFKLAFNWNDAEEYSRTMVGFANNQGGYLIFGVKDRPRQIVGLQNDNFDQVDPEKITQFIKSAFSNVPNFELETATVDGKNVGWIYVHPTDQKPIICTKTGNRCLKDGAIFFRYPARTDVISSSELVRLIDEQRKKEQERWFQLFRQTASIGVENAALLNLQDGVVSGSGGAVIIDENLVKAIQFIKEGEFDERRGAPAIRIVGELTGTGRVIEKKVDPELKYRLIAKEVGERLGFSSGGSAQNATALIRYYGLRTDSYMHEFTYGKQRIPKYTVEVVDILKEKIKAGEFNPSEPHSQEMKAIRRSVARGRINIAKV